MENISKYLDILVELTEISREHESIPEQRQRDEEILSILNNIESPDKVNITCDIDAIPSTSGVTLGDRQLVKPTTLITDKITSPPSNISHQQIGRGGQRRFKILSEAGRYYKKFKLAGRRIVFSLIDPPSADQSVTWFKRSIADVLEYILANVAQADQVGLSITTPELGHNPAWVSFRRADQLHIDVVWEAIYKILQSNTMMFSNGQMEIHLAHVTMPVGSGNRLQADLLSFAESCRRKFGLVFINNDDNLCLPRALITAKAWVKKNPKFNLIAANKDNIQTKKVESLLMKTRIDIPESGCGIPELIQFQRYFKNYNIVVYEHNTKGRIVIFEGAKDKNLPALNLLYFNNHYCTIKSLTAAFNCDYYCQPCHKPYNRHGNHTCDNLCPCCKRKPPCKKTRAEIHCQICNRHFRGVKCFDNHKGGLCLAVKCCKICFKVYNHVNDRKHICGEIFCKLCKSNKPANHMCYICPIDDKKRKQTKSTLFIYFDFETRQETFAGNNNYLHEPHLCVVQQCCPDCSKIENINILCKTCGLRQHIFSKNPVEQFMSYVTLPRKSFQKITCIAHNGKAFDYQFILKFLTEEKNLKPKIILQGTKIILLEIGQIRFIDSISYIPMALSKLPKAFDLPQNLSKGYFPHFFNKLEFQNYVGPMPPIEYYSPDTMHEGQRNDFVKWYNNQIQNNYVFRMQHELVEYCIADVTILRLACSKFRSDFIQNCKVCPFTEATTIASACNRVFRKLYLDRDTIGIIPKNKYRFSDNFSKLSIKWLLHEEHIRGIVIKHAARGKEAVLGNNLKVDGYYEPDNHVFEFHGCYYHGHDLCFRTKRDEPLHDNPLDTMNSRYLRTLEKTKKLKSLGCTVTEMWECEFNDFLKKHKNIRDYVDNHELIKFTPLDPRDSFFGGRTGGTRLHYKAGKGERIKYVDFCSLYPYVSKYGRFPLGHPEIYVGGECSKIVGNNFDLSAVEGLVKCTILPPYDLYHPVLPVKSHGKLMFALCRTCCESLSQDDCQHGVEDRAFTGTWVSDEIKKAVSMGYRLLYIYEIWQYNVTCYDRISKTGGLFVDFINKFLKIKQEASGYPVECTTDQTRLKYINDYLEVEGVALDAAQIEKNAGKRALAKLMLNSFWGKFGQRENMPRTTVVSHETELYDLLSNPAIEVNHIIPCNDNLIYVNWKYLDEAADNLPTGNVVIAAYTTAQARLRLYDALQSLDRNVLYYDTDSIIYKHSNGEFEPPTGNCLGDLTDELEPYGVGSYITEFVCGGPKNYAFSILKPDKEIINICKVKGISLNYKNSCLLNFEKIKLMILQNESEPLQITYNIIKRLPDHTVVTKENDDKKYRIQFMKRKRVDNYDSVPYGFKNPRLM